MATFLLAMGWCGVTIALAALFAITTYRVCEWTERGEWSKLALFLLTLSLVISLTVTYFQGSLP